MKRNENELNLRNAFPEMPESCYSALMDAAGSVQEEVKVKKFTIRTALIAAAIMMLTVAVAMAAANMLGWTDFLKDYSDVAVPDAAVQNMQVSDAEGWQVGPCTFTVREQLADNHIVVSAIAIQMTDNSKALFMPVCDVIDRIGCTASSKAMAETLGISPDTTWGEAAKQLNVPLYAARALVEVDASVDGGEAMEDPLWENAESIVYFNMPMLNPDAVGSSIPVHYYLRVDEVNPDSGEILQSWVDRDHTAEIAVQPMIAEKTYHVEDGTILLNMPVTNVTAQQYVTGVYVKVSMSKPDGLSEDDFMRCAFGRVSFTDVSGVRIPDGMNLSIYTSMDADDWENVTAVGIEYMLGVDTIPDTMQLVCGDTIIVLK